MLSSILKGQFNTGKRLTVENRWWVEAQTASALPEAQSVSNYLPAAQTFENAIAFDRAISPSNPTKNNTGEMDMHEEHQQRLENLRTYLSSSQRSLDDLQECLHYLRLPLKTTKDDCVASLEAHFSRSTRACKWAVPLFEQLFASVHMDNLEPIPDPPTLITQWTDDRRFTLVRLKAALHFFNLHVTGKRATLIQRLMDHLTGAHRRTFSISWTIAIYVAAEGVRDLRRHFERVSTLGTPYPARALSMRFIMLKLLWAGMEKGLFRDDLPSSFTVPFLIYDDATSELSWPLYSSSLGFVWDPEIFQDSCEDKDILRLECWFMGLVPETKDSCRCIDTIKSAGLKDCLNKPFFIKNKEISVKLRLLNADHSRQWKSLTNKCGGHYRQACFIFYLF